jgi:hypothetical protein
MVIYQKKTKQQSIKMTPRNKILIPSIVFFIISLIVQLCITNWTEEASKISLYTIILGVVGSIFSMLIPNSYTLKFENNDWLKQDTGGHKITVMSNKHSFGKTPDALIFKSVGKDYELVEIQFIHDENGNLTIKTNNLYKGKVKIR